MKILPVSRFRGLFWLLGSRLLVVTLKLFRKKKEEASRNFKNIFLFHSAAAENLKTIYLCTQSTHLILWVCGGDGGCN